MRRDVKIKRNDVILIFTHLRKHYILLIWIHPKFYVELRTLELIVLCHHRYLLANLQILSQPGVTSYFSQGICLKSLPRSTVFPPKGLLAAFGSATESKSRKLLSRASNAKRWHIGASSQMMRSVFSNNSASMEPRLMLQILS
ncbi:uncharacterized protein LOC111830918 [Capsella rubella]|uniref:uncharacterized protein LOC111830918 n=1 Tax=Capsella rubella TaxID=81985 RepID=UPI000CD53686|nr:uncharacterized protein LOC111830918 [Capsella rubella]